MEAEKILSEVVDAYQAALRERLMSAYALGSLAHGGFSPLVSDIDLGLIIRDPVDPGDANTIHAVSDRVRASGSALAARLSVFWGTPATLRGEREGGRFPPLDRLDLIENGRLLTGADIRGKLARPDGKELLISGAEFALDILAGAPHRNDPATAGLGSIAPATGDAVNELCHPELLLARGIRRLTKRVLFPVRFMFTAATGHVGTNDAAVAWYLADDHAPASALVAAALTWRKAPPADDAAAVALLREQLVRLYLQYIDDHISRLTAAGQARLAHDFEQWRTRLLQAH